MMIHAARSNLELLALDEAKAWQQLASRDRSASFVYAVVTTGIFCCPGCPSRVPLRANTRFFSTPADAKAAGFRACLRCRPQKAQSHEPSTVAQMCSYIEHRIAVSSGNDRPVSLAELGKLVGISPFTAQRKFKQAMGVSPAEYQRAMRAQSFRGQLRHKPADGDGMTVTTAIYEAGYGSSSRAYEQTPLGMTPGRFLLGGRGETIRFATANCEWQSPSNSSGSDSQPDSWIIVASTDRGICWLALGDSPAQVEADLRAAFPAAEVTPDPALTSTVEAVLGRITKGAPGPPLPLDLRGTAFQLRVWKALQQIPPGETLSYSRLAAEMGNPAATRAVARACATNRVAVLVPCHRVVGASGALTGYRWGVERKRALLESEKRSSPQ